MLRENLTADGYTNAFYVTGGEIEFRVTINGGSGTVTLKRAPMGVGRATASNYEAFSSSTTVTSSTAIGILPGECWMTVQLSSSSTPDIDVELSPSHPSIRVKDTGEAVS